MVGIGEILWDVLPSGKQLGGAPANFAYHTGQLDNRGVVISCIGKDEDGREILSTLDKKSIENSITISDRYPTGLVTVHMDKKGIPSYTIHEQVAWDYLELNPTHLSLAHTADVVCFGTLGQRNTVSANAIQNFLSETSSTCIKILDLNLRSPFYSVEIIVSLLNIATILKLNDDELIVVTKLLGFFGPETALLEQLQKTYSLDLIILTKGAEGSRLFDGSIGGTIMPGYPVEVVDTVGAGDSFTAAVATGLCHGMSLKEIHPFASKVAAFVCQHAGATPQLPKMESFFEG